MARQQCSVCNSPVANEINGALQRREKLRDIEARTGFSRAALSRHSINCIPRETLRQHKNRKITSWNSNVWTQLPGEEPQLRWPATPKPWFAPKGEQIQDIRLVIEFEKIDMDAMVAKAFDEATAENELRNAAPPAENEASSKN